MRLTIQTLAFVAVAAVVPAQAQAQTPFDFSIKNIMRGPELYGRPPEDVHWSADSKWIYFTWVSAGSDWRERRAPYRVRATQGTAQGATPERLTIAQRDSAGPFVSDGPLSRDGRARVVSSGGDLYVIDQRTFAARRLMNTVETESNPAISPDGARVYFARDNNVFSIELATGLVTQLTDLRTGDKPTDSTTTNPQRARLEAQQRALLDVIRDRERNDSLDKADKTARERLHVPPSYIGKDREIVAIDIAPSGTAALVTVKTPEKGRQSNIPSYVTKSGYVEERSARLKVGDLDTRQTVLFVPLPGGAPRPLALFPNDSLANYVAVAGWNATGTDAALFAFAADNKSRLLYTVSSAGALHTVETLHDTAWVDGPCATCLGWYDQGARLWYVSEATGFAHLYTASASGGNVRALTSGRWEVRAVQLSPDEREFRLTTNEPSPAEEQLYTLPVNGGTRRRITTESGGHQAVISPNGAWIADVYSYVNRPPDLYLLANRPGAPAERLTQSASAEWRSGPWIVPDLVQIPTSDGVMVPAHLYRPQVMHATPNGAAVIFVHGAGYLHNVGNFWSQYPREYLFNQFLAQRGYVVLDLDYRGSDGYGRDWRTAIYRWMGGRDLQDHVDASKYLTQRFGVPATRIGIYGGSYGGFMTLMALFTAPDYFGAGAALRSVTDWAHYNSGYTSNILNFPQTDTLAYRRSSPIYFADGLRAPLLMCHGMVDMNVHYEDIVRLSQRLIELGKTDWELASYPVEDHGFVRPSSWADEYTRIFALFERTIAHPAAMPVANVGAKP